MKKLLIHHESPRRRLHLDRSARLLSSRRKLRPLMSPPQISKLSPLSLRVKGVESPLSERLPQCRIKIRRQVCRERLKEEVDPVLQKPNGKVLRWKAGKILGQGSEAQVIQALDADTGRLFVVKRLYIQSAECQTALQQEVDILVGLNHPHIVKYLGSEIVSESLCIYLEYMSGGSIKSLLDKIGPIPEDLAKIYIRQMLAGLAYLHGENVIHRDLKAANLLLHEGVVKLCDFGYSRLLLDQSGHLKTVRGSTAWTAPEVIKQVGYGRKADVWSLGCTVLEILTAKPPWSELGNLVNVLVKLTNSSDLPVISPELSSTAREFLELCLQRDPKLRPTVDELLNHRFLA